MTLSTANAESPAGADTELEADPTPGQADPARDDQTSERRRAPRLPRDAVPGIGSVTLYPRDPAKLLNISKSGMLVSCARRLMPDSPAKFVLRAGDRDLVVTGRVVRSQVVAIGGEQGVAYETAIHTDQEVDLQQYGAPQPPESPTNRREHQRTTRPFDGTCVTPNGQLPITVSDISDGGCFIAQANTVAPGDQLSLHIEIPGAEPIITPAEVLSADPEQGFAVHFLDRDEAGAVAPAAGDSKTPPVLFNDW